MRDALARSLLGVLLLAAASTAGTTANSTAGPPAQQPRPIVIGSKAFAENRILAHAMALLVEARTDIPVQVRDGLGGTLFVFTALQSGEIDIYPEYTGTAWSIVLKESSAARDPLRTYVHVAREFERRFGLRWLEPFGFSNSYALAVRGDVAERLDLRRVSDLLPHAEALSAGVSHEFLSREDGWPGLSAAYGLQLSELRGMEHGLAFAAIEAGEIDVIDAWTTDGKLLRYDVRVLEDDRGFWPPYHCAPVARLDVLERHPELADVLGELALQLDDTRMQQLNHAVEVEGLSFRDAALRFLREERLLDAEAVDAAEAEGGVAAGDRRGTWLEFIRGRLGITARLTLEHLLMALGAVLGASALAVPLGVLLTRRPRRARLVLGVAGVIQTVPSLALLALMLPVLGLGVDAAYAALFLYALLPILRNTDTGMREVDPSLVEAARGMGLTPAQVLLRIELPLASRTIVAGVRTATVISIGVATLAAFIGAGGLGEPIVTGLALNDTRLVLAGAVPAALLAVLVDQLFERLERRIVPGARG